MTALEDLVVLAGRLRALACLVSRVTSDGELYLDALDEDARFGALAVVDELAEGVHNGLKGLLHAPPAAGIRGTPWPQDGAHDEGEA